MNSLEVLPNQANTQIDPTRKCRRLGMTRRGLLQTLAGGLGAGLLASTAKAAPAKAAPLKKVGSSENPEVLWSTMLNVQPAPGYQPLYYGGIASLVYTGTPGSNGVGGYVYTMDVHSGAVNSSQPLPDQAQLGAPVGTNGFIVAPASDGSICAVNPYQFSNIGVLDPPDRVVSNLLPWNNLLLYVGASGNLVALNVTSVNGQQAITPVWQAQTYVKSLNTPRLVQGGRGQVFLFTDYDIISMNVSLQGGSLDWGTTTDDPHDSTRSTSDGANIYVFSQTQVMAFAALDGSPVWPIAIPIKNPPSPALAYGGFLYFSDIAGNFLAIDVIAGKLGWEMTLPAPLGVDLFIEDGVAYTSAPSKGLVFAIQLASQGGQFLQYQAPQDFCQVVGAENGLCIVVYSAIAQGSQASTYFFAGIDMATEIHGFFCESRLMADGQSLNAMPSSPTYRTRLLLVDPDKNPRAFVSVKVWSSDTVTITSAGVNHNIDNNGNAVWLQTDSSGEIDITSVAADISNPALYVWGTFMDRQEAIVLYPDFQTSQDLHNASSQGISTATTYNGAPLLPSGVTADQLTSTIQNTIGGGVSSALASPAMRNTAVARARQAADQIRAKRRHGRKRLLGAMPANSYLAYAANSPNMLYQQVAGLSNRPFVGGSAKSFTATFDSANGLNVGPWQQPPVSATGLLGFSFSDLKKAVTNGVDAIKKLTVTIANDAASAAHYIETEAGQVFNLVVQSFEDAITTLGALFKSVLGTIEKAVEWLSYLFDWEAIKATKVEIASALNGLLGPGGNFQTMITGTVQPALATLHGDFQKLENEITNAITSAQQQIGSSSIKSFQQSAGNNNDPTTIFSGGSYSQMGMLKSKLRDNAGQSTTVSAGLTANPSSLVGTWQQLATDLASAVSGISSDLDAQIKVFLSSFNQLLVDPGAFVEQAFGAILNILLEVAKDLANLILQAIDLSIELIVNSLIQLINGVLTLLTAEIHVPVLSDIFGGSMSFIDLCSWVIAVPVTIVNRARGVASSTGAPVLKAVGNYWIYWAVAAEFGAIVDALADGLGVNANDPLALIDLTFSTISYIHGILSSFPVTSNAAEVGIFLALQSFPLILSGVAAAIETWDEKDSKAYNAALPTLFFYYGMGMLGFSIGFGYAFPAVFWNPNGETFAENVINSFAYMVKTLVNDGPMGKAITVLSDLVLPTSSTCLGFAIAGGAA